MHMMQMLGGLSLVLFVALFLMCFFREKLNHISNLSISAAVSDITGDDKIVCTACLDLLCESIDNSLCLVRKSCVKTNVTEVCIYGVTLVGCHCCVAYIVMKVVCYCDYKLVSFSG